MSPFVASFLELTHIGSIRLAELLLEDALPMIHKQTQEYRHVLEVLGLGWQLVLPVRAEVGVELGADVGQQAISELIESPADTVAVGNGHGKGIRSGWSEWERGSFLT